MRFFKNCKLRNSVAAVGATSPEDSKGLTDINTDIFFTINGKPYQGQYVLHYSFTVKILINFHKWNVDLAHWC